MVDSGDLPEDEENRPEIEAFVDDFQDRIFKPADTNALSYRERVKTVAFVGAADLLRYGRTA